MYKLLNVLICIFNLKLILDLENKKAKTEMKKEI